MIFAKEGIKTITSAQICCRTILQNVKGSTIQLYIHIAKNNMLHVIRHLLHELLFVYLFFFLILTSLWRYCSIFLLHYSFLSVMNINVWRSIEQRTINASIDQRHSRVKTRMCRRRTF